jgi:hypothetical protein
MPPAATDQPLPAARSSGHPPTRPSTETPVASGTIPHERLATATCG